MQDNRGLPLIAFRWDMLGFGMCRASYIFCFVFTTSYSVVIPNVLLLFWIFSAVTAAAIIFPAAKKGIFERFYKQTLLGAAIISVCGMLSMLSGNHFDLSILTILGVSFSGIGCALLYVLWGLKLSLLPEKEIIVYVTLCIALSSAIILIVNFLGDFSGAAAFVFAIVALFTLREGPIPVNDDSSSKNDITQGQEEKRSFSTGMVVKLCVVSLIFPFAYHLAAMTFVSTTILNRDIEGVVVGGLALLMLLLAQRIRLMTLFRIILPLIVAAYLFLGLLPSDYASICIIVAGSGLKLAWLLSGLLLLMLPASTRNADG